MYLAGPPPLSPAISGKRKKPWKEKNRPPQAKIWDFCLPTVADAFSGARFATCSLLESLEFIKENAFPNVKMPPKYPKFSACGGLFPPTVVVWICFSYCPSHQFYHHYWECARAACDTFSRLPPAKRSKTSLLALQSVLPNGRSAFSGGNNFCPHISGPRGGD